MMSLDLDDGTLAGIAAFYAIVNIPSESLPLVFEKWRECCNRVGCCCSHFTRVMKFFERRSYCGGRSH